MVVIQFDTWYNIFTESTHDRVVASQHQMPGLPEYIGREVACMTAFEIISIFIGILTLLCAFGSLVIALLAFLNKRKKKQNKNAYPVCKQDRRCP